MTLVLAIGILVSPSAETVISVFTANRSQKEEIVHNFDMIIDSLKDLRQNVIRLT
ncbi:MAG TPA: hypothetical protein VE130_07540 [Nitrososphaeraceae archaeon]|nr:hypothetical protein [Nitrososphaeraceae archaeon]